MAPPLPGESQFLTERGCRDIFADVDLQNLAAHPMTRRITVERLLLKIEAIRAIQVAVGAARLGHGMEGGSLD